MKSSSFYLIIICLLGCNNHQTKYQKFDNNYSNYFADTFRLKYEPYLITDEKNFELNKGNIYILSDTILNIDYGIFYHKKTYPTKAALMDNDSITYFLCDKYNSRIQHFSTTKQITNLCLLLKNHTVGSNLYNKFSTDIHGAEKLNDIMIDNTLIDDHLSTIFSNFLNEHYIKDEPNYSDFNKFFIKFLNFIYCHANIKDTFNDLKDSTQLFKYLNNIYKSTEPKNKTKCLMIIKQILNRYEIWKEYSTFGGIDRYNFFVFGNNDFIIVPTIYAEYSNLLNHKYSYLVNVRIFSTKWFDYQEMDY